jgi:GNAT superfamily N-acetyltransferase
MMNESKNLENIVEIKSKSPEFIQMVYEMRIIMNNLNQSENTLMMIEATQEAESYFTNNRKVFIYKIDDKLAGYSVLKIEDKVCWLDWIFVKPEYRGTDTASKLFDFSEKIAEEIGSEQLYVWVHPDNQRMLKFLKKKGYDVLNLMEVKKKKAQTSYSISIFGNEFRY